MYCYQSRTLTHIVQNICLNEEEAEGGGEEGLLHVPLN